MSDKQKNQEEGINGDVCTAADMMDKVDWGDFLDKHDIEQDLQDTHEDMRKAYQTFD